MNNFKIYRVKKKLINLLKLYIQLYEINQGIIKLYLI
jgi:hypothetical protein